MKKSPSVDFVEIVHGTGFPEIRPWRPRLAIPVDDVDFLTGTDCFTAIRYFCTSLSQFMVLL